MKCPHCKTKFVAESNVVSSGLMVPAAKPLKKKELGGYSDLKLGVIWCKTCKKVISCIPVPEGTCEEF
jgi:hypothetical protein